MNLFRKFECWILETLLRLAVELWFVLQLLDDAGMWWLGWLIMAAIILALAAGMALWLLLFGLPELLAWVLRFLF